LYQLDEQAWQYLQSGKFIDRKIKFSSLEEKGIETSKWRSTEGCLFITYLFIFFFFSVTLILPFSHIVHR
jgi:hypothetical protein